MPSRFAVVDRMSKILKRTSIEMQKVTSRLVPDFSPRQDVFEYPRPSVFMYSDEAMLADHTPFCSELRLTEDLLSNMELIVKYRQMTFATLAAIAHDDPRADNKAHILNKIQDIETRSIIFLTLPPKITGSWEEDGDICEQVNVILNRFLEQAEICVEEAETLVNDETSSEITEEDFRQNDEQLSASPLDDLPQNLKIPGFSQHAALAITRETERSVFNLLSNPDLRSATSLVKMIVGSACCQITGNDPEHCLSRLNYLLIFFDGRPVRPPGGGQTAAADFRLTEKEGERGLGPDFAWHCLFNSALAQAERQFAHSLDSVLPFAAVLATLLAKHPKQIPRYLSRMATACPLLTAYAEGAAATTFFGAEDGTLQLWRGICRLFAAVALARCPPDFGGRPEVLNPKLLWITIAGLVRQPFIPRATAEVLHGLIETGGFVLLRLYKHQATRLFKTISSIISKSNELSTSAPELALLACLETFVGECKTNAKSTCYGVLLDAFWN